MYLNNTCLFFSILTFEFDLIFGSFLTFWGRNGLFLASGWGSKTVLGFTHVDEQLSFSMLPSFLTFDFDSILSSCLTFWGPNWLFLGLEQSSRTVLWSSHID